MRHSHPVRLPTPACRLPLQLATGGYDETLTLALVSREDNFGSMLLEDDGNTAVVLANPQR